MPEVPDVVQSGPHSPWPFRIGSAVVVAALAGAAWYSHENSGTAASNGSVEPPTGTPTASNHAQPFKHHRTHASAKPPEVFFSYAPHDEILFTSDGAFSIKVVGRNANTHTETREVGIAFSDLHCSPQHELVGKAAVIFSLYNVKQSPKDVVLPPTNLTASCLFSNHLSILNAGNLTVVGDKKKYSYTTRQFESAQR